MRSKIRRRKAIGIVAAIPAEAQNLLKNLKKNGKGVCLYYEGTLYGKPVVLTFSGMGKVNAAHAATLLIRDHAPSLVVNIGVGGAYPSSGLKIGDIAVAEKEIYGDEGVLLQHGFQGTDRIGIPLLKKGGRRFFNEFPLDRKYAHRTMRFLAHRAFPFAVSGGRFVTVSTCTGTKRRALELVKRFGAICENMEGAAIAHVCKRYGIPMIEIRGISNIVEDRNKREWDIPLAAENCQRAALACIETLWDAAGGA